jgi:hypothetical protein
VKRRVLPASIAALIAVALLGCLDAIAPRSPSAAHAVSLGIVPVFDGRAAEDGIPGDVDLIRIVLHNPPAADTTLDFAIAPGQDSITIKIPIAMTGSVDTVGVTFQAIRSSDGAILYSGTESYPVSVGPPSPPSPLVATYVGPGRNILSISITPSAASLKPGDSLAFSFTALDSSSVKVIGMPALYTSRSLNVVRVNAAGLAKGVGQGSTYVVVTSGARSSIKDSALVTVQNAAPALIALSASTATFNSTVGTSDPAAQTVNVTNSGGGTLGGLAVGAITYGAGGSGWLAASLSGATAPATLTLTAAKGSLAAGTYTATVPVQSASASNSPQSVSVTFQIVAAPTIGLSTGTVTFTDTLLTSDPAAQTVNVTAAGGSLTDLTRGTISYGAVGSGWLTATLSGATAPATLTLTAAKGSLAAGTYTAAVPVQSASAGNSPQSVSVTFQIAPPPAVAISIAQGYLVMLPGDVTTLLVSAKDAVGNAAPTLGLTFSSRAPGVASVGAASGTVSAVATGSAVIRAQVPTATGTTSDSSLVVVPANGAAVIAAIGNGHAFDAARVGDTVKVRVLVDLRAVSGEVLGSYNAQLNWNPAALTYVSSGPVAGGFAAPTKNETQTSSGQLRFSSADPSGSAGPVALIEIRFVGAAAGSSPFTLALTDLSAAKTFTNLLPAAVVVSGSATIH